MTSKPGAIRNHVEVCSRRDLVVDGVKTERNGQTGQRRPSKKPSNEEGFPKLTERIAEVIGREADAAEL
jgi:hypothetical protein